MAKIGTGIFVLGIVSMLAMVMSCDTDGNRPNYDIIDSTICNSLNCAINRKDIVVQLKVDGDTATTLPVILGQMPRLKYLSWWNGNIKEIPDYISELKQIEHLSFRNNRVTKISPRLSMLNSLSAFSLVANRLSSIPNEILSCKNLRQLHLGSNILSKLPDEICDMDLTWLDLDTNRITTLPDSIHKLVKLELLNIRANPISSQEIERIRKALPNLKYFYHD